MRIALLEDDPDQAELFRHWLVAAGHICDVFDTGKAFLEGITLDSFDTLILDWMVPDTDGYEVLGWVRANLAWRIPVMFLTARDDEDDIVRALELGADDYILKPAKQRELLARLSAVARRAPTPEAEPITIAVDTFRIDLTTRELSKDGEKIEMTHREFALASFFLRNIGRIVSRAKLLEIVWGRNPGHSSRTVDTHISRLRVKLGLLPEHGWRISAIYLHGYRLERVSDA
jgi:DNA-binding response OmpR family regulator